MYICIASASFLRYTLPEQRCALETVRKKGLRKGTWRPTVAGIGVLPAVSKDIEFQSQKAAQEYVMATLTDSPRKTTKGVAFLMEESAPQDIFTPEDLSEEHLAIGHMVDEFWANEVEPNLPDPREEAGRRAGGAAEVGGTGSDRDDDPGGVWRHGNGSAVVDGGS